MSVRNQSHLCRSDFKHEVHERLDRVAFDVELSGYQGLEKSDVVVLYVSFIRSGVNCYTFCTKFLTVNCCLLNVRHMATACISDGGNLIYVYAKSCHNVQN